MSKKTLVIGAVTDPGRYSYMAVAKLKKYGHEVIPLGIKEGKIEGLKIETERKDIKDLDTVSLYINPTIQPQYYDYILSQQPKRVVFNPGTENESFEKMLLEKGIEPLEACTLVMLSAGNY